VNLAHRTELQERLAAEYALGTLRGAARTRFARWMRDDAAIALAVARWETRLAPLAVAVAPVEPPARLWSAIEKRIGAPARRGLWDNVAFWRGLSLTASGMAAALLGAIALLAPHPPQPAPPPVVLRVPSAEMAASYLAVLTDPKTQRPAIVVSASRNSAELWVKTLDPAIHVADKSLELWALPAGGAPRSLGLVAAADKPVTLRLAAAADQSLGNVPALAVSLEPAGGSRTGAPTGPVLFSGPCVKSW
jgi:anti-sigma-K factor RskA